MNCTPCSNCEEFAVLGCFDPCGELEVGVDAAVSGVYTLKVGYLGSMVVVEAEQTIGEPITFPLGDMNENYTFKGKVYDPEGEPVVISGEVSCFQFSTSTTFNFTE